MKDKNQKREVNRKLEAWYNAYVVDDIDLNKEIAGVCMRAIQDQFDILLYDREHGEDEDEGIRSVLAIYNFVFEAIIEELKKMQDKHSEIAICIGDEDPKTGKKGILEIGYDNLEDDDSEKQGNFSPFVNDLGGRVHNQRDQGDSSVDICTKWMSENMKSYPKLWDAIATTAAKNLANEVNIPIAQTVIILPIFALIQSQLCEFMDVYRKDKDEASVLITFASVIDVLARKMEDNSTKIEFKPKPSMKLGTKSDAKATTLHEDED